jgi:hypothetical protein
MHFRFGIVLSAAASLMLSGCLAFGSLERRGTAVDQGVGALQNQTILLNLARASTGEPLYFVSIGNVSAQGQTDLHLAGPSYTEGPGLLHSDTLNELTFGASGSQFLDNTTNTNFQMGVFSTHDFYAGMTTPLGADEVNLLLHQGYPRELVFFLTIEKARITPKTGAPFYIYNNPRYTDPKDIFGNYAAFEAAIQQAMVHGLTTEVVDSLSDQGAAAPPTITAQSTPAKSNSASQVLGSAGNIQFVLKKDTSAQPEVQECFDQALATSAGIQDFQTLATKGVTPNFCGTGKHSAEGASAYVYLLGPDQQPVQVEVIFRSTYGIFQYLGGLLNLPADQQPTLKDYGVRGEFITPGRFFNVTDGVGVLDDCFTAVTFESKRFCAPRDGDGSETTRQIFSILTTLVALKQTPGDLPAAQSILIAP